MVLLFLVDLARELFGLFAGVIPPFVLLEIAVFLLSLKIVWMIHFQVNELSRRMRALEHRADPHAAAPAPWAAKGRSRPV
ncbi:MAG: hypothetical protein NTU62_10405 [Spirochaetes bacterium]|nr:hypothetical protein [Spirochaetota bacterium]